MTSSNARPQQSASLLISAGFDLDALAYDVNTGKQTLRLRGHRVPLVSVQEIPSGLAFEAAANGAVNVDLTISNGEQSKSLNRSRCMSMDLSGVFRVWDLTSSFTGMATCVMTFDIDMLNVRGDGGPVCACCKCLHV